MTKDNSDLKESSGKKQFSGLPSNFILNLIIAVLVLLILFLTYALLVQITRTSQQDDNTAEKKLLPSQVQIEVLNGCGIPGAADKFTEYLRTRGFDVVNKGNYSSFDIDNTLVIDRSNKAEKAALVAEVLGVENKRIIKQFNYQYFLDVSIIIGKDFNSLLINK